MEPRKKQIIVVDKDETFLSILTARLEAREYEVIACSASLQVIQILKDEIPDLILIDSQVDKVNGLDLSTHIRQKAYNAYIPIIMMTGKDAIAEQIMGLYHGNDDFIIKPFTSLELQLRIEHVLQGYEACLQANPLTKLPGNIAIEHKLREKIQSGICYSVCYVDIDNFKSFNDKYGFDKGDDIIFQTARILKQTANSFSSDIFIGHVGGDDFVALMHPDFEEQFARNVITEFDRLIPTHYSPADRKKGFIKVKNRRGKEESFPLASLSVAAVTNVVGEYSSPGEIAGTAAEVKKFLKTQKGSNYLRDRREQPFESIDDATYAMNADHDAVLCRLPNTPPQEPLGQMLINSGLITEQQLNEALKEHFATGKRLGRVLVSKNMISSEKIGNMLEKKLGVNYVSFESMSIDNVVLDYFDLDYFRLNGVVPFKSDTTYLHVAMLDPFCLSLIDEIESETDLKVVPYVCLEQELNDFLDLSKTIL